MKITNFFLMLFCLNTFCHASYIVRDGEEKDWEVCCQISLKQIVPIVEEVNQKTNFIMKMLLRTPEDFVAKRLNTTKENIFSKKNTFLFVVEEDRSRELIGFFAFKINAQDQSIAHVAYQGFIEEKISPQDFCTQLKRYFQTKEEYKEVLHLFAVDLYPEAQGPLMTAYRQQSIDYGFKPAEHQNALDGLPWWLRFYKSYFPNYQLYILDVRDGVNEAS